MCSLAAQSQGGDERVAIDPADGDRRNDGEPLRCYPVDRRVGEFDGGLQRQRPLGGQDAVLFEDGDSQWARRRSRR
jgi:hypothetical protein